MRKSKAETAQTRRRIVEVAAKAFRKQGIDGTGVAEIMATAGLTHGGFYRHFKSKEQLVAEAISVSPKNLLRDSLSAAEQGAEAVLRVFQDYVTPSHRDAVEDGCPLAAMGSELVRAEPSTRHVVTSGFRKIIETAAPFMLAQGGEEKTIMALNLLNNMVGALTMARMVDDPVLSTQILTATRQRIDRSFDVRLGTHKSKSGKTKKSG